MVVTAQTTSDTFNVGAGLPVPPCARELDERHQRRVSFFHQPLEFLTKELKVRIPKPLGHDLVVKSVNRLALKDVSTAMAMTQRLHREAASPQFAGYAGVLLLHLYLQLRSTRRLVNGWLSAPHNALSSG